MYNATILSTFWADFTNTNLLLKGNANIVQKTVVKKLLIIQIWAPIKIQKLQTDVELGQIKINFDSDSVSDSNSDLNDEQVLGHCILDLKPLSVICFKRLLVNCPLLSCPTLLYKNHW